MVFILSVPPKIVARAGPLPPVLRAARRYLLRDALNSYALSSL